MKLHLVQISPCCRIVWLYCKQNNIEVDIKDVDIFEGEHKNAEYEKITPHGELPVLVDKDIVIYGACAVLLYLAEKYTNFNRFGDTEKERQMVKSLLYWTSSELHKSIGYRTVYPHFMVTYQLQEDATEALIENGTRELTKHFELIENTFLAKNKYLTGNFPTVADYYIATMIVQLEWINFDITLWPQITKWLTILKSVELWEEVHKKHEGFLDALKVN